MNYVKNLIKILLFVQCLLLSCVCDKKEAITSITTEQNKLNLVDFGKCPFNEESGILKHWTWSKENSILLGKGAFIQEDYSFKIAKNITYGNMDV